ncbi:lipoyl protein ligase domain-containing protein [Natrialbaceae archaeon A-arb3/5]
MRIVRGRAETIATDREATETLRSIAAGGEPAVRVWIPHRQVAFGRRDANCTGYDRARSIARERGFPPVERDVGGHAVAYDGETTIAFVRAEPVADVRRGTADRYDRLTADVERALSSVGLDLEREEPADSFCPGAHSLSIASHAVSASGSVSGDGLRKLVGFAQRVQRDVALAAGIVIVDANAEFVTVFEDVYDALGIAFDPATVGSVAAAGGPDGPAPVRNALEAELVGDEPVTIESVDELLAGG